MVTNLAIPQLQKKGDIMRFINSFFTGIVNIQVMLDSIENWYKKKRKYMLWIFVSTFVTGLILILCNLLILGAIIAMAGMLFTVFDSIIGWKNSVRKVFKICVIYNLFFSFILTCLIQEVFRFKIITPLFIVLYLLVWLFLSLISNGEVALLVNEIISGIAATVFTIGTYLINMFLESRPSSNDYIYYFHSTKEFEIALENGDNLALSFIGIGVLEKAERLLVSLLPIIGVSALCIIMIKIKMYWMKQKEVEEPEETGDK